MSAAVYGGLAFCANYDVPEMRVSAGLAQVASSFFLSLFGITLLEKIIQFFSKYPYSVTLTIVSSSSVTVLFATVVHVLNGTPNLALTIIPYGMANFIMILLYVCSVERINTIKP